MIGLTTLSCAFNPSNFKKIDDNYVLSYTDNRTLQNLSSLGTSQAQKPDFSPFILNQSSSIVANNILELYANAVYEAYGTRLTELKSKKDSADIKPNELKELKDLEQLSTFKAPKLEHGLPLTQKLSFNSEDGIKNYALYAAADTVNELAEKKGMHTYISMNQEQKIDGFLSFRHYAKGKLLDKKSGKAIYVSQIGAFPLANGKGSQLIAEVTRQNRPVVLLTRKFNSRAKAIYSKLFTQLNTQKSNQICNKLDYDSQKYDAYLYSKT